MPKAYSYVRFRRPEQLRGDSLRRQRQHAADWAAKHGLVVDESLTDIGVSAYCGANRVTGSLGRFLRDLQQASTSEPDEEERQRGNLSRWLSARKSLRELATG